MLHIKGYYQTRAIQICIVFTCSQILEGYLNFTHSGWIGFAVMMIYAGFDSGASIHRSKHRFWGAVLGLLLSYFLFILIRFNDDFIWLIVPFIIFMAYFTVSKLYVTPTIFTVSLTGLGADYYQSNDFAIQTFFEEYFFATLVAYWLCIALEYYVFKRSSLSKKFYAELQENILTSLNKIFYLLSTRKINASKFLKLTSALDAQIIKAEDFLSKSKHDYAINSDFLNSVKKFDLLAQKIYKRLHILYLEKDNWSSHLEDDTNQLLIDLKSLQGEYFVYNKV